MRLGVFNIPTFLHIIFKLRYKPSAISDHHDWDLLLFYYSMLKWV